VKQVRHALIGPGKVLPLHKLVVSLALHSQARCLGRWEGGWQVGPHACVCASCVAVVCTRLSSVHPLPYEAICLAAAQKLEGTDGSGTAVRGVAATVSALLAEATDPDKLCRMFIGWASWV
jgi:hypothetical protein